MILLVRRLFVLLAIGLVHLCLIWNGDILVEYALAGFVVLPFLFGPRRLLAGGGRCCSSRSIVTMPLLPPVVPLPGRRDGQRWSPAAHRVYGTGGFFDVLAFRIRELPAIFPLHVMVFPRTVGLFLFGAAHGAAASCAASPRTGACCLPRRSSASCWVAGLSLAAAGQELFDGPSLGTAQFPANGWARSCSPWAMPRGHRRCQPPGGRRLLGWAAPLGRMAFTNYLAQSVICGWIFYGYGLGQFDRLGAATRWRSAFASMSPRSSSAPGGCAATVRSRRVALALVHVRRGAADAATGEASDQRPDQLTRLV